MKHMILALLLLACSSSTTYEPETDAETDARPVCEYPYCHCSSCLLSCMCHTNDWNACGPEVCYPDGGGIYQ